MKTKYKLKLTGSFKQNVKTCKKTWVADGRVMVGYW